MQLLTSNALIIALGGFNLSYTSSLFWPTLPGLISIIGFIIAALVAMRYSPLVVGVKSRPLFLGILFGILWGASVGHWHQSWQLSGMKFQQDVIILGQIAEHTSLPYGQKLHVDVVQLDERTFWWARHIVLYVNDQKLQFNIGDKINAIVRLKPAHAVANPHSHDGERSIVARNIVATGSVKHSQQPTIIRAESQHPRNLILSAVKDLNLDNQRWILALSIADRSGLSASDWSLLQRAGIAHLFAISGMHLSIVAAFVFVFIRLFISAGGQIISIFCNNLNFLEINLKPLIYILVIAFCCGYAYLANWLVPVSRAWFAVTLVSILSIMRWHFSFWQLLVIVMAILCVVQPYSIYSVSLWLSLSALIALGTLITRFTFETRSINQRIFAFIAMQFWLSILLVPISVNTFGVLSVVSIAANLIAVPIVSFVVVPGIVISVIDILMDSNIHRYMLSWVNDILGFVLSMVEIISNHDYWGVSDLAVPLALIGCLVVLAGFCLVPGFSVSRCIVGLWSLPIAIYWLDPLPIKHDQDWILHVFDVGQGSAAAITTGDSVLIFDTGASSKGSFSYAHSVIMPFLRAQGLDEIDAIFISHFDNDHAGGLDELTRNFNVKHVFSPPQCRSGDTMMWQGLVVETLWPVSMRQVSDLNRNDNSCVVRVSDGKFSVLFTGDVQRQSEWKLVEQSAAKLDSTVLIAPHHGSNTSSTWAFIGAVQPEHTVVSAGYLNRWGFPTDNVVMRYQHFDTVVWQTAKSGYLQFTFPKNASADSVTGARRTIRVKQYRTDISARWYREFN